MKLEFTSQKNIISEDQVNNFNLKTEKYDLTHLFEMASQDYEFMIELIKFISVEIPNFISQLQYSLQNNDFEKIVGIAHRFAPYGHYTGTSDLMSKITQIEMEAKNQNGEIIEPLLQQIAEKYQILLDYLKNDFLS